MNTQKSGIQGSGLSVEENSGTIDYWFMLQHRRLRERFSMETLTRHERRLGRALSRRRKTLRGAK